jgi:hypothetical protein
MSRTDGGMMGFLSPIHVTTNKNKKYKEVFDDQDDKT